MKIRLPLLIMVWVVTWVTPGTTYAQETYLVDDVLTLDASATEGNPDALEWYITAPGCTEPSTPTAVGPTHQLTLDESGEWTVRLHASYLHTAPEGGLHTDDEEVTLWARTVAAEVDGPADDTPINEPVTLDGTASRWSDGTTPSVSWLIDGPASYTGCGNDLTCTIPADSLWEGTYTATLTLSDPESGDVDSDSTTFVMIDDTLIVDFTWSESQTDPLYLTFYGTVSPTDTNLETAIWNFGDGSGDKEYMCGITDCLTRIPHTYEEEGLYEVTLEVISTASDYASVTHSVQVGESSDPPTAAFTVDPSAPSVMQSVLFTESCSCTGTCTYEWVFGDGAVGSGTSVSHVYQRNGTFTVELTVANGVGSDTSSQQVTVSNCWTPTTPSVCGVLDDSRTCYGDQLVATAQDGQAFLWSTGSTTASTDVSETTGGWLSADDGTDCWGTVDFSVSPVNCGDASGDVNLDGTVNASDAAALLGELTDGDGDLVEDSGGGNRCAPGGDVNTDGMLDGADMDAWTAAVGCSP